MLKASEDLSGQSQHQQVEVYLGSGDVDFMRGDVDFRRGDVKFSLKCRVYLGGGDVAGRGDRRDRLRRQRDHHHLPMYSSFTGVSHL